MNNRKVVLITGASSGMGKETALQLIKDGYTVYGAARRIEKMKELQEAGGHALQMDISLEQDIEKAVRTIEQQHGGVDILVNNAGYGSYGSIEDTTLKDARYQFEVNLFGLARLTQLVLPGMREKGAGKVINISSMGGRIYTPLGAWYHASKHALEGWSDCLRLELQPFGIDVVVIQPGIIRTEFGDVMTAPMLDRSGEGPYGDLAQTLAKSVRDSYEKGGGSSPEVVVRAIRRAARSGRPRTRYAIGQMAKPLIYMRKFLPDRWFDKAVMQAVK